MELLFSIWGLSTFWSVVIILGGLLLIVFIIAAFSYPEEEVEADNNDSNHKTEKEITAKEEKEKIIKQVQSENDNLRKEIVKLREQLETQNSKIKRFENLYTIEKERKLKKENQYLKSQLSPHFLNNTLNNIYSLLLYDPESARESILKLKRFLSYLYTTFGVFFMKSSLISWI